MSGDDKEKKPWIGTVPGILTGSAALLAAVTGAYVNVRGDFIADPPAAIAAAPAPAGVGALSPGPEVVGPQQLQLGLQRLAVHHNGEVSRADWRFSVEADGQPLFAFEQKKLDDAGGRNVVNADKLGKAAGKLELKPGQPVTLTVKGWRDGWFTSDSKAHVEGEGVLEASGNLAPIEVKAKDEKKGAFTFYFAAEPDKT